LAKPRRLHDELNAATIFVTHDQEEALEMSDPVVVMNHLHWLMSDLLTFMYIIVQLQTNESLRNSNVPKWLFQL